MELKNAIPLNQKHRGILCILFNISDFKDYEKTISLRKLGVLPNLTVEISKIERGGYLLYTKENSCKRRIYGHYWDRYDHALINAVKYAFDNGCFLSDSTED